MTWLKREISLIEEAIELNPEIRSEILTTVAGGAILTILCCASIYLSFAL